MKQNTVVFICIIASCCALYMAASGGKQPAPAPGGYQPVARQKLTAEQRAANRASLRAWQIAEAGRTDRREITADELAELERIKTEGGDPREMSY